MSTIQADGARFQRPTDSSVNIKSGTCSSVSYVLRYASPITARPATSIATLRCKTVSEQVCHRLADALAHKWPAPQGSRTYKGKEVCKTVPEQVRHRLASGLSPQPPGEIITREP